MFASLLGADGWRRRTVAHASALTFLVLLAGCRESAVDAFEPGTTGPPVILFARGDSLTFDAWALDGFGDRILSSQTSVLWRVVDTGGTVLGRTRVTTIIEQAAPGAPPVVPDTLLFQFRADGDIYQYAFLARSVLRRESRTIPPAWDRIGAFSFPVGGLWTVGAQDSAGTDLVQGRILDDRSYFSFKVNGVETLFRGYSASLAGTNYLFGFTVAAPPPAMVIQREEPGAAHNGQLRILNALRVHGTP